MSQSLIMYIKEKDQLCSKCGVKFTIDYLSIAKGNLYFISCVRPWRQILAF